MPVTVTGQSKNANATVSGVSKGTPISESESFLLKEDGDFILLETGDKILLNTQDFSGKVKPLTVTVTGVTKT